MITDYVLAFFLLVLSGRLFKLNESDRQTSIQFWNFAFIATALAAILGGTAHGFALYLSAFAQAFIWKGTVYAIGFASFFMLAGTIMASVDNPVRKRLLALATLQILIYSIWMLTHNDFKYVIFDYVPAMIVVIALQVFAYTRRKEGSAKWIIGGVLVSFFAGSNSTEWLYYSPTFQLQRSVPRDSNGGNVSALSRGLFA